MTEALRSRMSEPMREQVRAVDCILLSGFKTPTTVYCLDLDTSELAPLLHIRHVERTKKFKLRQARETRKMEKMGLDYSIWRIFGTDSDIMALRRQYTDDFFMKFDMAFRNYVAGEWLVAKDMLEQTTVMLAEDDGPSLQLL